MASLTIRNLSVTPLQLVQVERFGADATESSNGWSELVFGLLRAPYDYLTGCGTNPAGGSTGSGLVPRADVPATTTDAVTDLQLAPFSTTRTTVKAPDPASEVMRLTFHADFGGGAVHSTYTVDLPAASPRSIELQLVKGQESSSGPELAGKQGDREAAAASFTAVYTEASAHLVILSSAALDRWMSTVDGSWPLSSLSLPGTHNSPAFHYALPSVRCQAVDVRTQLDNGVRFLDVRVSVSPPKQPHADPRLVLVHSVFPVALLGAHTFRELYSAVCGFLDAHPTETVLVSVKREGLGKGTDADLAHQLLNHYTGGPADANKERPAADSGRSQNTDTNTDWQPEPWRWFTEPRIPSLDEARGRIVLIRRFRLPNEDAFKEMHNGRGWGLDGSVWPDNCEDGLCGTAQMRLQDFYGVMQTTTIDTKINYVRGMLAKSASASHCKISHGATAASNPPPLIINFLTGSNFFNMRCWPENVAAKVNPSVIEYLCVQHGLPITQSPSSSSTPGGDGSTGIVVTDWVGHRGDWDLLRCIVAWNARLQLKQ
ncbi:hypothetical protein SEPCBS119000_003972 [Sporothrix epigloea]|uniref:Phosphatidylinositol-specific phospholipase C X domain-containing protein n=1 Tax=Sporothrix epigloea TaxID=1892477 RepID=A0ABP0DTN5_9PEZI